MVIDITLRAVVKVIGRVMTYVTAPFGEGNLAQLGAFYYSQMTFASVPSDDAQ